ncbi:MAG: hypothetical protein L0211_25905 [Planctomycetaceae bacterium]|nr:hypothetical protein [Planctomycetaceae bacterium]
MSRLSLRADVLALVAMLLASVGSSAEQEAQETPHWIGMETTEQVQIGRTVNIREAIQGARLKFAADFCQAEVEINGRLATVVEPYSETVQVDVTPLVKLGQNQLVIGASQAAGPAAVALELTIETSTGKQKFVTDESWQTIESTAKVRTLGRVAPQLWGAGRRSADIDSFDNYEQWRQASGGSPAADPASFWLAPGFEIALVRTAQPDEGSWVSMAFDPQGRVTIAREDQGLLRMTLDDRWLAVAKVETIERTLLECRGLLYAYGSLYANANNSKGLYRLTDEDNDGQFDKTKLLREFPGGVGHGRNDLALGPDGMIYSIHGDSVDVPTADVLDRTSPLRESRRGKKTSEGYLVRMDRDGKGCELLCGGLRNPFGIAFNGAGDAFTYDADAEFDMGTPWYRPTRLVQLTSGADYAWRGVTGKWPPYFPDHPVRTPATLDIGRGSPTAVAFGTGSTFPHPYRDALFILDWAYGRVVAVHLAPRGAGYRAAAETFLKGRPLNVTDLAFGRDGAMYLITGGRKTQSALYKISFSGNSPQRAEAGPHEQACIAHSAAARALRHRLEALHGRADPAAINAAWPHLGSADPWIRCAARVAIELQPLSKWRDKALAESDTATALTALAALAAGAGEDSVEPILDRLLRMSPAKMTRSQCLTLMHLYQGLRAAAPASVARQQSTMAAQLVPVGRFHLLDDSQPASTRLRHELAQLLVDLGAPAGREHARSLLTSERQEDRMMGLLVLRNVKEGWTMDGRREYFIALNDAARFVAGEGLPRFLASLREDSLATLSAEERQALAGVIEPRPEPEPDIAASQRPVVKAWTLDDLLPALNDSSRKREPEHIAAVVRGAAVFREALCIRCHRVGARGPAVGPDLTHVAARFSRKDVLASVLTPSAVVAENYRNVQVMLKDGRSLVGRVVSEGDYRSQTLRLATDPLKPAQIVELNKLEIERSKLADSSPMPDHLLDTFDEKAILDLLAFFEAGAPLDPAPGK